MNREESPLQVHISFGKLLDLYEDQVKNEKSFKTVRAKEILKVASGVPELRDGFTDPALLEKYRNEISLILEDTFSSALTHNEIKAAMIPFQNIIFNSSKRFDTILKNAGEGFEINMRNMPEGQLYILGCSVILKAYYGIDLDFRRPLYFDIPDENGILRNYRIMYNADFVDVFPTKAAIEVTKEDVEELMDHFNNLELWKQKFPPGSWIMKGFVISNMFDVTVDQSISDLKTTLLELDSDKAETTGTFERILQSIYNNKSLRVGFSFYDQYDKNFQHVPAREVHSYLLFDKESLDCKDALCASSYEQLYEKHTYFAISDVEKYYELSEHLPFYKNLYDQGIGSAIFAPVSHEGNLLGILELISPNKHDLHSVNANKLEDIMPYLVTSILRSVNEESNQIDAIIQHECTSIHSSVYWKFENEARKFLRMSARGEQVSFGDISFEDVHPLYGQVDIKNSSDARNTAIQKDLLIQFHMLADIFVDASRLESLPIYDEINFRINEYLTSLSETMQTNSEQKAIDFLLEEIHPVLDHLKEENTEIQKMIINYYHKLKDNHTIYKYRKAYDTSVTKINKKMASMLDKKQEEAQKMFPHYFERYKTDGIEHNMYIGASIANNRKYSPLYLQNLRLWQLRTMCEMENAFYQMQIELPLQMEVSSLIFVHGDTLSIHFRMDERRFDVDGTYNARYEVIKKRIDKAHIAGTNTRITEEGKICIVYSSRKHEKEYMRYIKLLQAQKYISENVENFEVEPLQGVSGLKVLRAEILYTQAGDNTSHYTLHELSGILQKASKA
ncbi:GAF domain-containing protein [Ascidiimonas aurantiaca]|uniref:GAF domain-containing protein n=1 Tax=Ascidiimonas aurantiaca TaxID=1685432 RepID=UPI0030EC35CC